MLAPFSSWIVTVLMRKNYYIKYIETKKTRIGKFYLKKQFCN